MNYSTEANKMDILGTQFVNAGTEALDIQSIKIANFTDGMDWMKIYTPGVGYQTYIYYADTIDNEEDFNSLGEGWGDGSSVKSIGITLDPGQGFWLNTQKNATITMPGEVLATESESMELAANKMDIMASPYPIELDIQKIKISSFTDGMDWMKLYTPGVGYQTYIYYADTIDNEEDFNSMGEGWGDGSSIKTVGVTVNPGQGFWINTQKDATVTINR